MAELISFVRESAERYGRYPINMSSKKAKRMNFIISIWTQGTESNPVWRGSLETAVGERQYFGSLDQLNDLLNKFGWSDEENSFNQANNIDHY